MAGKNGYTAKQFIEAIKGSGGIVSTIAKRVNCDWQTAKKYIDTMPTVAAAYQAEKESLIDLSESVLITNIQLVRKAQQESGEKQDAGDAKWYLSKMAKNRGYGDKVQVENINIDLSQLTREQLERIANGEHPATVMANSSQG